MADNSLSVTDASCSQNPVLTSHYVIRPMQPEDLDQVCAIESSVSPSPWTAPQFAQSLQQAYSLVIETQVRGYAVVASMADQAELHNIAIHPDFQGQGFGRRLVEYSIEQLSGMIKNLYLEVRVSNIPAIRLYQQLGFEQLAERRDYYQTLHGREDALIMGRQIDAVKD